ncbi:MAG: rhomboid family intramembrane serine protease [Chitinophagaceae bacterium]
MSYKEKEYKQRLSLGQRSNTLIVLISINLIIFIVLSFIKAFYLMQYKESGDTDIRFFNDVLSWFALPGDIHNLGSRPWTIISFMFTEISIWQILGNMLWLWMFGYILQDLTGNRKIVPVYIYGSLAGAIAFLAVVNLMPAYSSSLTVAPVLGASAGVMAIAIAVTTLAPGYKIFPMLNGGFPIWILTTLYLVIDIIRLSDDNSGIQIAHLAGALTGFLFIYFYRKGIDWGGWMNNFYDWVNNLFNPDKPKKGKTIKQELFYKTSAKPYQKKPNITQQRVDEILDKINQYGYDALSEEEKELLKKASRDSE